MSNPEPGERWGILGGTFDPVHAGHLTLARDIKSHKHLDGILLVPSFKHPFKNGSAEASFEDRTAMLRLATQNDDAFSISGIEQEQNLSGYTIDTIRATKRAYPDVEFCFIIGADNIAQIHDWHQPEMILQEIPVIAGTRPGFTWKRESDSLTSQIEYIQTGAVDLSSSNIRRAIREGTLTDEMKAGIEPKVLSYIVDRKLYQ